MNALCLIFNYRQYQWQDEAKGKKSKLSAPQYVDLVMSTCQKMLQDDALFPTKFGLFTSRDTIHCTKQTVVFRADVSAEFHLFDPESVSVDFPCGRTCVSPSLQ